MKTKSIFILLITICSVQLLSAQGSKVSSAFFLMDDYKNDKNIEDLIKAKKVIDEAVLHESTMNSGKAWYYRGLINNLLSKDKSTDASIENSYTQDAITSFEKALSIEDKKFKDDDKVLVNLKELAVNTFNGAIEKYKAKDYKSAYSDYELVSDIDQVLKSNDSELTFDYKSVIKNAALSAEFGKMYPEAIKNYEKLREIESNENVYLDIARVYNNSGDDENYIKTLNEGVKAFPESSNLLNSQISYLLKNGQKEEAAAKLDKAIELNPENLNLYLVKASSLEKSNNNEEAIKLYEKVIEKDPNNEKALFNLGALHFRGINAIIEKMNELTTSPEDTKIYNKLLEERKVIATKVKPYFEKVLEINPNDGQSKKTINKINQWLNN